MIGAKTLDGRSTTFFRLCDDLKIFIFNYGAPSHPELYHKSKKALLDYVWVEYEEGDTVAESILSGVPAYPPFNKPLLLLQI